MNPYPEPLDLKTLKVLPLRERENLSALERILVDPTLPAPAVSEAQANDIAQCARDVASARERKAAVILMYGAHLIKNGAMRLVIELMERGWVTHLATNGAGAIHDWELAYQGRTEESVRKNVATGTFGAWEETGRFFQIALLAGALRGEGFGRSMGRCIEENGAALPSAAALEASLRGEPGDALSPARADALQALLSGAAPAGGIKARHPHAETSLLARAFRLNLPFTVHPGIGYDIISNHPAFNGAVVGRAGGLDFRLFGRSVENLDGGVVLSVGSAIMAPQVFEKGLSCVNNLRLQAGRAIIRGHSMYVVDIQDGGKWDWSRGEPPKDNPAYYLRFCKSFARMGGRMQYVECDNVAFLHNFLHRLEGK